MFCSFWFLSWNLYYLLMLTKSKIQYIKSLHDKQGRRESWCFLVEGRKGIEEFLSSDFEIIEGFFTTDFLWEKYFPFLTTLITLWELDRITTLSSNRDGLLVVKMRSQSTGFLPGQESQKSSELTLILDGISDPGNLGTIIRTADWYGITHIIASSDSVDCYSPKVIMATMGSFTRVSVSYVDLETYLSSISWSTIYWAYLDGDNIHEKNFPKDPCYLVIGSESHGIRPHLEKYITDKVTIPRFGLAESLNAWVATAIILDNIARDIFVKKV